MGKTLGIENKIQLRVLAIARRVRSKIIRRYGQSHGTCCIASEELLDLLRAAKFRSAETLSSFFRVRPGNQTKTIFPVYEPHVVVVLRRRFILDVTGDQFNSKLLKGHKMQAIIYGSVAKLSPYYNAFGAEIGFVKPQWLLS